MQPDATEFVPGPNTGGRGNGFMGNYQQDDQQQFMQGYPMDDQNQMNQDGDFSPFNQGMMGNGYDPSMGGNFFADQFGNQFGPNNGMQMGYGNFQGYPDNNQFQQQPPANTLNVRAEVFIPSYKKAQMQQ